MKPYNILLLFLAILSIIICAFDHNPLALIGWGNYIFILIWKDGIEQKLKK